MSSKRNGRWPLGPYPQWLLRTLVPLGAISTSHIYWDTLKYTNEETRRKKKMEVPKL